MHFWPRFVTSWENRSEDLGMIPSPSTSHRSNHTLEEELVVWIAPMSVPDSPVPMQGESDRSLKSPFAGSRNRGSELRFPFPATGPGTMLL